MELQALEIPHNWSNWQKFYLQEASFAFVVLATTLNSIYSFYSKVLLFLLQLIHGFLRERTTPTTTDERALSAQGLIHPRKLL